MALPTVNELKAYLRIETTAEDTLLSALLARAQAMLVGWIDTPIAAVSATAVDRAESLDRPVTSLVFPRRPCVVTAITDADGASVATADYTSDPTSGIVYGKRGFTFWNGPYTITANVGLSLRADYATLEPLLAECIIDLAADLYQRRTPGAISEKAGDTHVTWDASRETVARIMRSLRLLKLGVAQ